MATDDVPEGFQGAALWVLHHRCPNQYPKGVFCGGHLTRGGRELICDKCGSGWRVEQGSARALIQTVPFPVRFRPESIEEP